MEPRVGVGVFVFHEGKFLMGWRKGSHGANTWTIPGGHMEFGETPEQTAIREVKEETSLSIANVCFAALTNDVFEGKIHYVTIWMTSDLVSGEPTVTEPDKYVDQQWFDFDNLPDQLFLPWRQLLKSEFLPEIKRRLELTKNQ
jgi:8-oxo-dGTP diphosphatase